MCIGSPYGERLPGREQSDAERRGGVKRGLPLFMAVSATRVRRIAWRERSELLTRNKKVKKELYSTFFGGGGGETPSIAVRPREHRRWLSERSSAETRRERKARAARESRSAERSVARKWVAVNARRIVSSSCWTPPSCGAVGRRPLRGRRRRRITISYQ